jgi:hypothetical protein
MVVRKNLKYFWKSVAINRAGNIFPKYSLFCLHEIAMQYPREKKYSSSFYDSLRAWGRVCHRLFPLGWALSWLCIPQPSVRSQMLGSDPLLPKFFLINLDKGVAGVPLFQFLRSGSKGGSPGAANLKALLLVQTVLLRIWKAVSFVLEDRRGRERTRNASLKVCRSGK